MSSPLLTIAIPTYNRAALLQKCLHSICNQSNDFSDEIELIVSDNASNDNTEEVVLSFIAKGNNIKYFKNSFNKGFDFNFKNCINNAKGKYVWLFGDDDMLMPNTLSMFLDLLRNNDLGSVYLNSIPFVNENEIIYKGLDSLEYEVYSNPIDYYKRVHYLTTFITGNIINKSVVTDNVIIDLENTNLIQLNWTIPSIFAGKKNAFVSSSIIAAKNDNTGGYKLITTFAENYNKLLTHLVKKGYDKKIIGITNLNLLNTFFPQFIHKLLFEKHRFSQENGFAIMLTCYWSYLDFWRKIFPLYVKYYIKNLLKSLKIPNHAH